MMETEILLLVLLKIATVMVMGSILGLFSYLLDYCFWSDSIFEKYLPWLAETMLKRRFPEQLEEVKLLNVEHQETHLLDRASKLFFYKIMGGCIVCTNVWLGFISWIMIEIVSNYYGTSFNWFYSFPYILTSSTVLRKLIKH